MSFEELDRIDREWEKDRERYLVTTKYGRRYVPSTSAAVIMGLLTIGITLFWAVIIISMTPELGAITPLLPLFAVVFVIGGMFISVDQFRMAARYYAAFRVYQHQRAEAEGRLEK